MKYRIVKIHKADAFYSTRKDCVGAIVSIKKLSPEWAKDDWGPLGFRPIECGKIVSSPTNYFSKGEYVIFHAVKLEKA